MSAVFEALFAGCSSGTLAKGGAVENLRKPRISVGLLPGVHNVPAILDFGKLAEPSIV